jgi:hypothetical protein
VGEVYVPREDEIDGEHVSFNEFRYLFGLVLAFIMVERGKKLPNMDLELAWVTSTIVISLSGKIWKVLVLDL